MSTSSLASSSTTSVTPTPSLSQDAAGSASSSSPSAVSTDSADGMPSGLASNATLYLYTFLATLVLLLAVSSGIVIRSLVMRRRHQRFVEAAIRAGTWNPSRDPFNNVLMNDLGLGGRRRRRRDIGEKPRLWEVRLANEESEDEDGTEEEAGLGKGKDVMPVGKGRTEWADIMPLSARYMNPRSTSRSRSRSASRDVSPNPDLDPDTRQRTRWRRFLDIIGWRQPDDRSRRSRSHSRRRSRSRSGAHSRSRTTRPSPSPSPSSRHTPVTAPSPAPVMTTASGLLAVPNAGGEKPDLEIPQPPPLRVTVLIAMPSQQSFHSARSDSDEGPSPVVEFGVVDVEVGGEDV